MSSENGIAVEESNGGMKVFKSGTTTSAVVYSGAVHIPVCYGSVAVPTTSPHRSQLYHRICYIRDGADLPLDAFYRWQWCHSTSLRPQFPPSGAAASATAGYKRKRERTEGSMERGGHRPVVSMASSASMNSDGRSSRKRGNDNQLEMMVDSPSRLYSIIDHVDFVLPKSFPHPRRSVFEPPFMVQDDTWAEHMVEIHLYFKAELIIPPMAFLHHCRLYLPPQTVPRLSALSVTTVNSGTATAKKGNTAVESNVSDMPTTRQHPSQSHPHVDGKAVPNVVVVSERKDALRIFHPTVGVVQFLKAVNQLARDSFSEEEFQDFLQSVYYAKPATLQVGSEKWKLRYEEEIQKYTTTRFERSLSVLQNVVRDLRQEQEQLLNSISTTMGSIIEEACQVQISLRKFRDACVKDVP